MVYVFLAVKALIEIWLLIFLKLACVLFLKRKLKSQLKSGFIFYFAIDCFSRNKVFFVNRASIKSKVSKNGHFGVLKKIHFFSLRLLTN